MPKALKKLSRKLRAPFNRHFAMKRLAEYHAQPRSLEETVKWVIRNSVVMVSASYVYRRFDA